MNDEPLISILVPSFNQGDFIENTILSVLKQRYSRWELFIQDGGSSDHTADICRKYVAADSRIRFHSERDRGFADAVNKILEKCSGEICSIQSSDDFYAHAGVFTEVAEVFKLNPGVKLVFGKVSQINAGFQLVHDGNTDPGTEQSFVDPLLVFALNPHLPQSSTFFNRARAISSGKLDEEVDMVADTDFWTRITSFSPPLGADEIIFSGKVWSYITAHPNQRGSVQSRFYLGRAKMAFRQLYDQRIAVDFERKKQRCTALIQDAVEYYSSQGLDCGELEKLYAEVTHKRFALQRRLKVFLSRFPLCRKFISYHCVSNQPVTTSFTTGLNPVEKWFR